MADNINSADSEYDRAFRNARRQVRRMRGWYLHAFIYIAIVGFAWLRFLFAGSFESWYPFHRMPRMPLGLTFGWGFGLIIHGLVVFARVGPFGQGWEDRQVKRLLANRGLSANVADPSDRK
jgi:2TM domain